LKTITKAESKIDNLHTPSGSSLACPEKFTHIFRAVQLVFISWAEIIYMKILCTASGFLNRPPPHAIGNDMTIFILQGGDMPHLINLSETILKCSESALHPIVGISEINFKQFGILKNVQHEKVSLNQYLSNDISFVIIRQAVKNYNLRNR
jgi:hypothetical protein